MKRRAGFTLLEIILASTMFAMIMAALYVVLNVSLRLQRTTEEVVTRGETERAFVALMRDDLENMMRPNGILAGAIAGSQDAGSGAGGNSLEFSTASGKMSATEPWGDIQTVKYYLSDGSGGSVRQTSSRSARSVRRLNTSGAQGSMLVRTVQRNLTTTEVQEEPPEEVLLERVALLTFEYFDGQDWQDEWDSTAYNNAAPRAVRVRVDFEISEGQTRPPSPVEMIVPIPVSDQDAIDGLTAEDGAAAGNTGGDTTGGGAAAGGGGGAPGGGGRGGGGGQ